MPELKEVLTDYVSSNTPSDTPPFQDVIATGRRRISHRKPWLLAAVAAGVTTLVLGTGVAVLQVADQPGNVAVAPEPAARTGEVPFGETASCARRYTSQAAVARGRFAFDGTVTDIGRTEDDLGYTAVTFEVHEWFRGSAGPTVTIGMPLPSGTTRGLEEHGLPIAPGTRLLVSGMSLQGGGSMDDAVAWSCGFTRYYDRDTASQWRDQSRAEDPAPRR